MRIIERRDNCDFIKNRNYLDLDLKLKSVHVTPYLFMHDSQSVNMEEGGGSPSDHPFSKPKFRFDV